MEAGKVVIIGAGPGDPELLTIKAARFLQDADVVLTDRLVSEEILWRYVNPIAEIIFVGKEGGKSESTNQLQINELLAQKAREHKLVVRLKGGDVSIFSNMLDELATLQAHGISYELVPGITAAMGAAAYAGIPLTARGHAKAVRFMTYSRKDNHPESHWEELAQTEDTLVFYMAGHILDELVLHLQSHGIAQEKAIAVIEQATTPMQNVRVYRFSEWPPQEKQAAFVSPTLVIIGRVAALHEQFGWKKSNKTGQSYFQTVSL